jgi:cysteine desulfurase
MTEEEIMQRIYLDYAATTPTDPTVVQAMLPYFHDAFGNPSAIYSYGQEAKNALEEARGKVARLIGARDEEIIFTSGGTEADNFALKGAAYANQKKGNHIITSAIEHHAVLESCKFLGKMGYKITYLPVDKYGLVDPDSVKKAITDKTILISVMHANNEIGTIQPISEIGKIAKEAGILFHSDAVQTAGHIPVNVNELGVDLLSMSGHKLYGPKGVGVLYTRKGSKLTPFMHGGGQERGRRASTENVPGIVGLGQAAELAGQDLEGETQRLIGLRDKLISGIVQKVDRTHLNGHPVKRLPNNVNISVEFVEGESMCLNMDIVGICASTGSACSSGSLEASHVLLAIGLEHVQAHGSLRFTLGKWTTEEEVEKVLEILPRIIGKLRAMSPLTKNLSPG